MVNKPDVPFVLKLRIASEMELDYWEERKKPPNLSILEFKVILQQMRSDLGPIWEPRKSKAGLHGALGERNVFKLEFTVTVFQKPQRFFLKGYFFDEDCLKGVTIQSFRRC